MNRLKLAYRLILNKVVYYTLYVLFPCRIRIFNALNLIYIIYKNIFLLKYFLNFIEYFYSGRNVCHYNLYNSVFIFRGIKPWNAFRFKLVFAIVGRHSPPIDSSNSLADRGRIGYFPAHIHRNVGMCRNVHARLNSIVTSYLNWYCLNY